MSDLISRSAFREKIVDMMNAYPISCQVLRELDKFPTVEAKPVVHCRDCEHWGTGVAGETEHVKCCEYGKYMVGENGFCCYADMRGGKNA